MQESLGHRSKLSKGTRLLNPYILALLTIGPQPQLKPQHQPQHQHQLNTSLLLSSSRSTSQPLPSARCSLKATLKWNQYAMGECVEIFRKLCHDNDLSLTHRFTLAAHQRAWPGSCTRGPTPHSIRSWCCPGACPCAPGGRQASRLPTQHHER